MAIYTLPNRSQYNTALAYDQQTDTGSISFIENVQNNNEAVSTSIAGENSNIPRIKTMTWTDTSYTGSNYIFKSTYNYNGNSYICSGIQNTFNIEDK